MEDHLTISSDPEFEVEVHPAFASECTVDCNGEKRSLYKQDRNKPVDVRDKGHPKQHQIRIRSKSGKRDVTLKVNDAAHSIAKITVELYPEDHDPNQPRRNVAQPNSDAIFTLMDWSIVCPPDC